MPCPNGAPLHAYSREDCRVAGPVRCALPLPALGDGFASTTSARRAEDVVACFFQPRKCLQLRPQFFSTAHTVAGYAHTLSAGGADISECCRPCRRLRHVVAAGTIVLLDGATLSEVANG